MGLHEGLGPREPGSATYQPRPGVPAALRADVMQQSHGVRAYTPVMSTRNLPDQHGDLPRIGRPATSALLSAGITSLAEVAQWSERDLRALHGVGPKAIRLLREALADRGLSLHNDA